MKNILIYGRGKCAERFIHIISEDINYKLIGVTDTYVTEKEVGEEYYHIAVCSCEKISDSDVDYIVVCSFDYSDVIMEQLKEKYPEQTNFYTVSQFFIKANEEDEPKLKKNELYQFFMYGQHRTLTKWLHYFEIYDQYFSKYRNKELVFCEVGIFQGGSLQMWKNYFGKKATIIGIDVDKECMKYADDNILIEIGSQGDKGFWDYIKKKYPQIDILLDDGGHEMALQKTTFECMFPHLQDNGIYMCEDTHTSYFEEFGGEYKGNTYIEYAKNFVDDINAFHSRTDNLKVGYNTFNMGGVHFYDSMVVVEKKYRKNRPISMLRENGKEAYIWPF